MVAKMKKKEALQKKESKLSVFFSEFSLTKKNRRRLWIMFGIGILFLIGLFFTSDTDTLWIFFIPLSIIFAFYPIGIILIINDKYAARNLMVIIAIIIIGVFFKKMHWPGAGHIFTLTLITLSCGYFFLALKNYFSIKNNTYLRIVSTLGALFISLMSTGMVFKMQHWPGAGIMLLVSLVPSLIFTMLVLVTLPGSDYIRWQKEHKFMFSRKLLIPWIFYLIVSGVAFLVPKDIDNKLFYGSSDKKIPFKMEQYEIEQVDGLEQNQ